MRCTRWMWGGLTRGRLLRRTSILLLSVSRRDKTSLYAHQFLLIENIYQKMNAGASKGGTRPVHYI